MPDPASRMRLWSAFAIVYIVWGSTYLAIRYAIETIPPLLMAGTRFLVAGLILLIWSKWRGAEWPSRGEWRTALILGTLLLLFGNGGVTYAEQRLPSGLAALLVTSEPLWLVLLVWAAPGGKRPTKAQTAGLALGFCGVALLIAPWKLVQGADVAGMLLVLGSAFSWAAGSVYSTTTPKPKSPALANATTMLCGGTLQIVAGLALGEGKGLHLGAASRTSLVALLYLSILGSLVAFSAYTYLLSHTTPAKASTYAFVNPVVAVLLGWMIASEPVTTGSILAMIGIVGGVILLTLGHSEPASMALEKPESISLIQTSEAQ